MSDRTPGQRAFEAAEELAAEGNPVTARAVQQRAQVNMNVASPVARDWNAQQAQRREVPPAPDKVLVRLEAIWRDAVEAARDEHQVESDGWAARLKAIEDERDGSLEDVGRVQEELDQANSRLGELEAVLEQARADAAAALAQVAEATARATAAEGVADGLRQALAAINTTAKKS